LIVSADEEIIELNNGCLCCTVRGDLIRSIEEIYSKHSNIDQVVIETSGLADPGPVIQSFMVDDRMQSKLMIDAVVTTVDCRHIWQQLESHEAQEQIAFADIVILNKIDLVDSSEIERIYKKVCQMNRFVQIYQVEQCNVNLDDILSVGAFVFLKKKTMNMIPVLALSPLAKQVSSTRRNLINGCLMSRSSVDLIFFV
jgi:G3E family GTPase